jgi:hypothetical protein
MRPAGKAHFAKIVGLLLVTAALTWYARQGRNNPFEPQPYIQIVSDSSGFYLKTVVSKSEADTCVFMIEPRNPQSRPPKPETAQNPGQICGALFERVPVGENDSLTKLTFGQIKLAIVDTKQADSISTEAFSSFLEFFHIVIISSSSPLSRAIDIRDKLRPEWTFICGTSGKAAGEHLLQNVIFTSDSLFSFDCIHTWRDTIRITKSEKKKR